MNVPRNDNLQEVLANLQDFTTAGGEAAGPASARAQMNTSKPAPRLKSRVSARARISSGQWSLPLS